MSPSEIQTLLSLVRQGDLHALATIIDGIDNGSIPIGVPGSAGWSSADNTSARSNAAELGDTTEPADLLGALIEGAIVPSGTWTATDSEVAALLNGIRAGARAAIGTSLRLIAMFGGRNGVGNGGGDVDPDDESTWTMDSTLVTVDTTQGDMRALAESWNAQFAALAAARGLTWPS